jgi:hypothetical protein
MVNIEGTASNWCAVLYREPKRNAHINDFSMLRVQTKRCLMF